MRYRETVVTGRKWNRCARVTIAVAMNPPMFQWQEEEAVEVAPGQVRSMPVSGRDALITEHADPARTIAVLDPATGQPTGQTITEGQLLAYLESAYAAAAARRDAVEQARAEQEAAEAATRAEQARLAAEDAARRARDAAIRGNPGVPEGPKAPAVPDVGGAP